MFRKLRPDALRLAPLLLLASVPGAALADPPAGFVEHVEALRQDSGAPGIAIAIVENGETTLSQGWGVRKLGEPAILRIAGQEVARGELVQVDGEYGIRITSTHR